MNRAIELARKGMGRTSPNPLVGSVIVHKEVIIGEGYHQNFGGPHAEVNAINSVRNKSLLNNSTIYVTLEPCFHVGKTPPCVDLILEHKIPNVVICNADPNPKVAGKSIQKLKSAGVHVETGVLSEKGNWLNRRFFKVQKENMPYVILKWAQNQNGFMDSTRTLDLKGTNWITTKELKSLTHSMRAREDAILVGANTVLNDSPSLSVRHSAGENPVRIIIDPNNKIPENHQFFKSEVKTIVFSKNIKSSASNLCYEEIYPIGDIPKQILQSLIRHSINSLIVEGGSFTLSGFIF